MIECSTFCTECTNTFHYIQPLPFASPESEVEIDGEQEHGNRLHLDFRLSFSFDSLPARRTVVLHGLFDVFYGSLDSNFLHRSNHTWDEIWNRRIKERNRCP